MTKQFKELQRMTEKELCQEFNIPTYKTKIRKLGAIQIEIYYHDTEIVTIRENAIKINNGGFKTQTTKKRINAMLDYYNTPYRLYQKSFEWKIEDNKYNVSYPIEKTAWIELDNFRLIEVY